MTPERWLQVERIYHEADARLPGERASFLDQACAGNADLRGEVERMLAGASETAGFLDAPAVEVAARALAHSQACQEESVTPRTISHYRILEKLGEGGMGVVYRAFDTQLQRPVALKLLPPEHASNPGRRARLLREARAASALHHPNIVGIHQVGSENGVDFIAMEFIEGKTLRDLNPANGLPLSKVLDYASQIAGGLAKAHAAGIVHRDLKPGNIMLSPDGVVKLLDFGLARRVKTGEEHANTLTMEGSILGTPAYMSPEQARGEPVDARSDVFSLGSVLYEMVTGHQAFEKDSHISTLAAVVEQEPRPLPFGVHPDLAKIIARCLRKDPARRYQHIGDVKVELEDLKTQSDPRFQGSSQRKRRLSRRGLWLAAAAAAVLLLTGAGLVWRQPGGTPPGGLKAVLLTFDGAETSASLSPHGDKVAFRWNGEKRDNFDIYVKQIGTTAPPLRLTTNPAQDGRPAWSPDDRWIAFRRPQPDGKAAIMLISSLGGPERKLAEIADAGGLYSQISWTPDARWLTFGALDPQGHSSIWAIDVDSGEHRRLTTFVTPSPGSDVPLGDIYPALSPDGSVLAFARQVRHFVYELYVLRLTRDLRPKGEPVKITDRRYQQVLGIAWTANGSEIVFGGDSGGPESLWRVPVSGGSAPQRLNYALPGAAHPAIAGSPPRLVYTWTTENINIWHLDMRTGERKMLISSTSRQMQPQYSPDGSKIALNSNRSGTYEIWTCDADATNCLQITSCDGPQCTARAVPRWSPDGRFLAFDSTEDGQRAIYVVAADGGKPRRLTYSLASDILPGWSHDGNWVYFTSDRSGRYEVWKVAKDGGEPIQVTRSGGYANSESADGQYLYYTKFTGPGYFELGLFRMPARGGEEIQIFDGLLSMFFAVTSKGLYFKQRGKPVQLLDAATGKVSAVAGLDGNIANVCVSRDDAYAIWHQTDRYNQNLMLVEGFR